MENMFEPTPGIWGSMFYEEQESTKPVKDHSEDNN